MHVLISRIHLIDYLVEDGITSSVHAKHTFSRTSIMLRISGCFHSISGTHKTIPGVFMFVRVWQMVASYQVPGM